MWTAANADGHIGADSPVFAGTPAKMRPNSAAETRALAIERAARAALDTQRFVHSRMVALHAADLCERYGLDPEKGWIAGLGHDLCKGLTSEEYLRMAALDGLPVSDFERAKPGMLHGRAAAVLLAAVFGIEDGDILEAVRLHTGGGRGMGALAKIVYLTDKIEAGRHTVARNLRELAFGPPPNPPLDELFTTVARATAAWLTERGLALAPETLELLAENGEEKNV